MPSWMPFFVVVTALAIVVQAIVLIVLFVQLRRTASLVERTVVDFNTKVAPLVARVQILVDDVAPRVTGIVSDASEIVRLARSEAQKVDRVVSEALERLRMQLIHVDHILTGVMETVEEAGTQLRNTVWGPVVKATAMLRGVQAGIDFFRGARQRRAPVDAAAAAEHEDEGMFI